MCVKKPYNRLQSDAGIIEGGEGKVYYFPSSSFPAPNVVYCMNQSTPRASPLIRFEDLYEGENIRLYQIEENQLAMILPDVCHLQKIPFEDELHLTLSLCSPKSHPHLFQSKCFLTRPSLMQNHSFPFSSSSSASKVETNDDESGKLDGFSKLLQYWQDRFVPSSNTFIRHDIELDEKHKQITLSLPAGFRSVASFAEWHSKEQSLASLLLPNDPMKRVLSLQDNQSVASRFLHSCLSLDFSWKIRVFRAVWNRSNWIWRIFKCSFDDRWMWIKSYHAIASRI